MDAPTADMRFLSPEERFWKRVDKSGECWLWTGPLFDGYGRIKILGALNYVHRLSYEWANGPVAGRLPAASRPSRKPQPPRQLSGIK